MAKWDREDLKSRVDTGKSGQSDGPFPLKFKSNGDLSDETKAEMDAKLSKPPVYQGVLAYFPRAIKEVARVSEFGKNKYQTAYEEEAWMQGQQADFLDAAARHMLDRAIDGETNTKDGDRYHLAQIAWDALAALEKHLREEETNIGK